MTRVLRVCQSGEISPNLVTLKEASKKRLAIEIGFAQSEISMTLTRSSQQVTEDTSDSKTDGIRTPSGGFIRPPPPYYIFSLSLHFCICSSIAIVFL